MAQVSRNDFNRAAGEASQVGFRWMFRGVLYSFLAVFRFIMDMFKQLLGK